MLTINGNNITTVRGDTVEFNVSLNDGKGHTISVTGNTVKFSVKSSYSDTSYIISPITLTSTKVTIPAATMAAVYPGRYVYDIQVTLTESGAVFTPQRGQFIVLPDVTTS